MKNGGNDDEAHRNVIVVCFSGSINCVQFYSHLIEASIVAIMVIFAIVIVTKNSIQQNNLEISHINPNFLVNIEHGLNIFILDIIKKDMKTIARCY